jgi:RIO kinase 2
MFCLHWHALTSWKEAKRKKLKQFTKAQNLKKKTEEKEKAVSAWQQFASKKNIGAKSIFRTPDNPLARVGVTGSGTISSFFFSFWFLSTF